jgi:tripartite-type tricarboxylate transporter receptor subunit TctC
MEGASVALTRRDLNRLWLGLAAAPFGAVNASAEDYPSRPVHLIVPYAGGGSGDLLARLLGAQLSNLWGQQVVI